MILLLIWTLTQQKPEQKPDPPKSIDLAGTWVVDKKALLEATLIRMTRELGKALTEEERKLVSADVEKTDISFELKADQKAVYKIDMGDGSRPIDGYGNWEIQGATVNLIIRYKWGLRLEPAQRITGIYHEGMIRMALARGMPDITLKKK
ncbi:MAG: hypothetical protein QNK37_27980 [Acidobacteriota bacterium]|nr:hypothetical protein [Acidobacteriota bacterium]